MDVDREACTRALDEALERSGLNAQDFARALGTSASRLSTYRKGTVAPSAPLFLRAQRLASALAAAREHGLMTAPQAAREIATAVHEGDHLWAFKMTLQARDHLRSILDAIPEAAGAFEAAPPSTGSDRWDTLLATLVRHEFAEHDRPAPEWTDQPALETDWVLDHPRWDERAIKARTPVWLAERRIFVAGGDLVTASRKSQLT